MYWYRTPPGVKVGREPFDAATRRTLEAQYPGIAFDWRKIAETAFPPPDAEYWRERRQAEKAARQARRTGRDEEIALDEMGAAEGEADEAARDEQAPPAEEAEEAEAGEVVGVATDDGTAEPEAADGSWAPSMDPQKIVDSPVDSEDGTVEPESPAPPDVRSEAAVQAEMPESAGLRPEERRRRSRRRRRARRGGSGSGQAPAGSGSPG